MKRSTGNQSTPAQRKLRVAAVVANANARGEKVPPGVALLPFRKLTAAERAYGATLEPTARESRRKVAA